ncbi:hypothetical protein KY290_007944 [Solanum tuberosum]|uniref:Uncharacterized protein n=1 Tax=Solanum tuberosum TaxID=4113 RepID=A0ABQ7W8U3_SOLTU|nr:hypothetical protein KY290_007944 [Solanum tuberosum]
MIFLVYLPPTRDRLTMLELRRYLGIKNLLFQSFLRQLVRNPVLFLVGSPIDGVVEGLIPHVTPKRDPVTSVDIYVLDVLIVSTNVVPESSSVRALKEDVVDIFFQGTTTMAAGVHIDPFLVEGVTGKNFPMLEELEKGFNCVRDVGSQDLIKVDPLYLVLAQAVVSDEVISTTNREKPIANKDPDQGVFFVVIAWDVVVSNEIFVVLAQIEREDVKIPFSILINVPNFEVSLFFSKGPKDDFIK